MGIDGRNFKICKGVNMNRKRTEEIKEITRQYMSVSNGDLDFADKIAKHLELTDVEKVLAGCYVRYFLISKQIHNI